MLKKLLTRDEGQDLAEYALLMGSIAIVAVIAVSALGIAIEDLFVYLGETCGSVLPGDSPPPDPGTVPDCYGSLLLPIMVGVAGVSATLSRWRPVQPALNYVKGLAGFPLDEEGAAGSTQGEADLHDT